MKLSQVAYDFETKTLFFILEKDGKIYIGKYLYDGTEEFKSNSSLLVLQDEIFSQKAKKADKVLCDKKGHECTLFTTTRTGYGCNGKCGKRVQPGTELYACRECNWDICLDCIPAPVDINLKFFGTVGFGGYAIFLAGKQGDSPKYKYICLFN